VVRRIDMRGTDQATITNNFIAKIRESLARILAQQFHINAKQKVHQYIFFFLILISKTLTNYINYYIKVFGIKPVKEGNPRVCDFSDIEGRILC